MAKSYVTQFTEYVNKQQNDLKTKLKSKGLSPSPNATLGSLVSDIDGLKESFGVEKYERDPNFPDIDTMFDNDPLRAVNGGPYAGCSYFIMQVVPGNLVAFKFVAKQTNSNLSIHYYGEKVIVSDGAEYENVSTDWTHTVAENGIFYGEDGFPYCLLKIYRTDFVVITYSNNNYAPSRGVVEHIDDTFVGCYLYPTTAYVGVYAAADVYSLVYFRYVGSNGNETNISTTGIQWSLPVYSFNFYGALTLKCIRIDGLNKFTYANQCGKSLKKLIINGQSYSNGNNIGYSGTSYPDLLERLKYLKLPYNTTNTTSYIYCTVEELFIPDSYTSVTLQRGTGNSYGNATVGLEKIHLGNGLTKWITSYSDSMRNLKHITTSENIYGINETAVTLDLSFCCLLTKQSVLNLFNGVANRTGMTANIIKLPARIKAFLTDEEKAILTNKNWTLS